MHPTTATADGEAGDKPGYISLIAGASMSEPNTPTGDQCARNKRNIKNGLQGFQVNTRSASTISSDRVPAQTIKEINRSGGA